MSSLIRTGGFWYRSVRISHWRWPPGYLVPRVTGRNIISQSFFAKSFKKSIETRLSIIFNGSFWNHWIRPSAIASNVPGAQGDRYKCRLLEFFAISLQASIETRYNEGFFRSLNTNILPATISEIPEAQGDRYKRRLLQFLKNFYQNCSKTATIRVFEVTRHEYTIGDGLHCIFVLITLKNPHCN